MQKGKFITIDGIECAGKSTQINLLQNYLHKQNRQVLLTREPGGTDFGEKLRHVLLDKNTGIIDPMSELLLMFAARIQHIQKKIIPALTQGIWVISDRFTDSSYAYQGGGRNIDFAKIKQLEQLTLGDFEPDLSLFLNVNLQTSARRMAQRGDRDRFEAENNEFFIKVYNAYQKRIKDNPQRIKNIDANGTVEQTFALILKHLSP